MARSGVNRLRLAIGGSLKKVGSAIQLGEKVIKTMVTRPFVNDDITKLKNKWK